MDNINFTNVIAAISPINDFVAMINATKQGRPLELLTPTNAVFKNINSVIIWKNIMTDKTFREFITHLDELQRSGIIRKRQIADNVNSYLFCKGMYKYNIDKIHRIIYNATRQVLTNQYAYMSNPTFHTKWDQVFSGKPMSIIHRTIDVQISVFGVYEDEFNIAYHYICNAIYEFTRQSRSVEAVPIPTKKLKKLQEEDPVLFLFKDGNKTKSLYSVICQKPRQPVSISDPKLSTSKIPYTKYWNFTTNTPIYYGCPTSKYPSLSFVGYDKHPQHLCLPCCNKKQSKSQDPRSRGEEIRSICLSQHKYIPANKSMRHVVKYGKRLTTNKLSHAHPDVEKLLKIPVNLIGVDHIMHHNINIVSALSRIANISIDEFIDSCVKYITPKTLQFLQNGILPPNTSYIIQNILTEKLMTAEEIPWVELFVELTLLIWNIRVFIIDEDQTLFTTSPCTKSQTAIICKLETQFYPVCLPSLEMVFEPSLFNVLYEIANVTNEVVPIWHPHEITQAAVNKAGQIYAIGIDVGDTTTPKPLYLSVHYMTQSTKYPHMQSDYYKSVRASDLLAFLKEKNNIITHKLYANSIFYGLEADGVQHYAGIDDITADIPRKDTRYIHAEINQLIINEAVPIQPEPMKNVYNYIYSTMQYKLLLMEFMNHLKNNKNTDIRNKLTEVFQQDVTKQSTQLDTILQDFPTDRNIIYEMLYSLMTGITDKDKFNYIFQTTHFEFDNQKINTLRKLSHSNLVSELRNMMSQFVTVGPLPQISEFPNTYLPCAETPGPFCSNNKLVVDNIEPLVDILAADILNSLKLTMIHTYIQYDNIIDYLDFKIVDSTIIDIYDLSE
jgi:hypothetical protein